MTTTAIKERPILFSGEMVRAILDGRKTQTRRVVKLPQGWSIPPARFHNGVLCRFGVDDSESIPCPYGKPGDRLWVRSRWRTGYDEQRNQGWYHGPDGCGMSFTVHGRPHTKRLGTQPSIHMPKWVAQELRMPVVQITDVRVERVQEISQEDAIAEGIQRSERTGKYVPGSCDYVTWAFREFWDSINGDRDGCSWAANPYAWVVEFERLENES